LLVRDPDQEKIFLQRFESFFNLPPEAEAAFSQVDLARVFADLQVLAGRSVVDWKLEHPIKYPRKPAQDLPETRSGFWITLTDNLRNIFLRLQSKVSTTLYLWQSRRIYQDKNQPQEPTVMENEVVGQDPNVIETRTLDWDPNGPRHFRVGMIGGKPAPRLDPSTLDQLADSLGYFQSEQPGQELDVLASVKATGRSAGIPNLVFHKRKQIRTVLILEDAFAEALVWNPIAQELAEGLNLRGIPVLYGKFRGSPEQFWTADGAVFQLEDLEDHRRGYLVLIFSDGKGFYPRRDTFVLEALARWPMVAWMELREPCFWDESTVLPIRYGLPIYPATRDGLLRAMGRFLTERGLQEDFSKEAINWRGIPAYTGTNLLAYVEQVLGNALLWAQACAMIQPVNLGLADALRQRFHADLPPERIERLFALPGPTHSVSGLQFSNPVL
ncbi:MAG: hypothetical protein L0Y56_04535, partial [Nitrospira sp.]|nr:hypothetical protein [Nitrospira sp.]